MIYKNYTQQSMNKSYELTDDKWQESLSICTYLLNKQDKQMTSNISFSSGAWLWEINGLTGSHNYFKTKEEAFSDFASYLKKNKLIIQYKLV